MTLPAIPENIPKVRHEVMKLADGCSTDPLDVGTAVTEAVGNVVRHAYRDGEPQGEVRLSGFRRSGQLVVTVEDDGVGIKPNPRSRGLGMGWSIIASLAIEVSYAARKRGGRLTMRFPCDAPAPA
jgi:anti-sigma regulatory factor (Ser/Thr protein kinase)